MREAFGGAFMLKMFLVIFFTLFGIICLTIVFGKSFRVKNKIIDYIEQYEECDINTVVIDAKQYTHCSNLDDIIAVYSEKMNYNLGYNVLPTEDSTTGKTYYIVNTYTMWSIPVLNYVVDWKISGKTKPININRNIN